jgi:hypothetical protein
MQVRKLLKREKMRQNPGLGMLGQAWGLGDDYDTLPPGPAVSSLAARHRRLDMTIVDTLQDTMTLSIPVLPRDSSPPSSVEALSPRSMIEADVRGPALRPATALPARWSLGLPLTDCVV